MDASCSHTGPRAVARKGTKVSTSRCHWNPSSMHVVSSEKASIHTGLVSTRQVNRQGMGARACGGALGHHFSLRGWAQDECAWAAAHVLTSF